MMLDDRIQPDESTVRHLIATQFPQWASQPIEPVFPNGWDNTTFRLGRTMKVRLPTAGRYVAQVEKEHRWLPFLAPHLPLAVPAPLAIGKADAVFPWPWSVYEWLDGETADHRNVEDMPRFALDLAEFLRALQRIPAAPEMKAGSHSFFRGGRLDTYDAETRTCLVGLESVVDRRSAVDVWEAALAAEWRGPDVRVHGDIAVGNLLVHRGKLSAVIDFGSCAVGDPACDLVIAWTFLEDDSRLAFQHAMAAGAGMWARARGWALWKALLMLSDSSRVPSEKVAAERVVRAVLDEYSLQGS